MIVVGTVITSRFAPGSKSEREAVFLQTETGKLLLRREGGNALHDPELAGWVGAGVAVEGVIHQGTLIAKSIRRLP